MAWLEFKRGAFRIGFRFGRKKHYFHLDSATRKDAGGSLGRFESNFRFIEQGVIESPPAGADLGAYIVSGANTGFARPRRNAPTKNSRRSLQQLPHSLPEGATEDSTRKTERIHIGHLRRHLDTKLLLLDVTTQNTQAMSRPA